MRVHDPNYVARLIAARCPEINPADVLAPVAIEIPAEILERIVEVLDALQERIDQIEARRTAAE
jgi:hypothetical protein